MPRIVEDSEVNEYLASGIERPETTSCLQRQPDQVVAKNIDIPSQAQQIKRSRCSQAFVENFLQTDAKPVEFQVPVISDPCQEVHEIASIMTDEVLNFPMNTRIHHLEQATAVSSMEAAEQDHLSGDDSFGTPLPLESLTSTPTEHSIDSTIINSARQLASTAIPLSSNVPIQPRFTPIFRSDATYLIVGGLGGLGRSIAFFILARGAKNIILTSRRGLSDPKAASISTALQSSYTMAEIHIAACDVSSNAQLSALLSLSAVARLPPIRGIINAAMIIQNALLPTLT